MFSNKEYLKNTQTPEFKARMQQEIQKAQEREKFKGEYNPLKGLVREKLPSLEVKWKVFAASDKQTDDTLDRLLLSYETCLKQCKSIELDFEFQQEMIKHGETIKQEASKGNAKAQCILGLMHYFGLGVQRNSESGLQWMKRSADQNFPKGLFIYGSRLQDLYGDPYTAMNYYLKAAAYGEVLAMLPMGYHCQFTLNDATKAYSYYLEAGERGHAMAYTNLGALYSDARLIPINYEKALGYYKKAMELGDKDAQIFAALQEEQLKQHREEEKRKEENLQTSKLHEALIVYGYFQNLSKMGDLHIKGGIFFSLPNGVEDVAASNLWKMDTLEFFNLGECLRFTSKVLLTEDSKGNYERIAIYNWHRLSKAKQKLLNKEGTRIILKFYNRKIANDSLPLYRIDNPDTMEILPATEKHCVSFEKLREVGRNLFGGSRYKESLFIYNYMLEKGYDQPVVIHSNMALCYLKLEDYQKARYQAKKCLEMEPTHPKAMHTVALSFFRQGKFEEARQAAEKLPINIDSTELKKLIAKQLHTEKVNSDFSLKSYLKKREPRERKLQFEFDMLTNRSIHLNLLELEQFFINCRTDITRMFDFEGKEYFAETKYLIEQTIQWRISNHNPAFLRKLVLFSYKLLHGFSNHQEFTAKAFVPDYIKRMVALPEGLEKCKTKALYSIAIRLAYLQHQVEIAAVDLEVRNRPQQAADLYGAFYPYNDVFGFNQADILREMAQYQKAQEISTKLSDSLRKAKKPCEDLLLLAAKCKRGRHLYQQSNDICSKLYEAKKVASSAYFLASLNEFSLGNTTASIVMARKAVAHDPCSEHVVNLCRLLFKDGQQEEAAKHIQLQLKKLEGSNQPNGRMWIKACLNLQVDVALAENCLGRMVKGCSKMIQLDPRNVVHAERLIWETMQKKPDQSEDILIQLQRIKDLSYLAEELKRRWSLLLELQKTDEERQQKVVRDCRSEEFTVEQIDPSKIHEQFLEIKRQTLGEFTDSEEDQKNSLEEEFTNYQYSFVHNGVLNVILFNDKLGLDPREEQQFLLAASKGFCNRFFGSNGIKQIKDIYELKINSGARLLGRSVESRGRRIIAFEERVTHMTAARVFRSN